MATTEIEKLERRYSENPQGLTFAPLAEVHRKNGDVARALELLKAGLELHPNYIPASIVLGRCHWDLGDLAAAESAFSHVLRLDDENVIALKSLADINEKLERFTEAQRWLNRLISVDRSNDEARQQLARLEAARQQPRSAAAPPQETAAPPQEPARVEIPVASAEPTKAEPKTEEPEVAPAAAAPAPEPAPESKPTALEFIDTSPPAAPVGEMAQTNAADTSEPSAIEPAEVEGLVSQEFVPPRDSYRSHPELTRDFVEPAAGNEELEVNRLEVETAEEVELQSSGASEFRVPNAAEDFMEAAVEPPGLPPPVPPAPAAPTPDLQLVEPTPAPAPRPVYSARQTKGQSVAAFFAAMLRARPSSSTNAAQSSSGNQSTPIAEPQPGDAAISFDDLFGASAESSPSPKGGTDPGKEDLDQFQTWLQNLKR